MRFRIIVQGMPLFTYLKGMPLFLKEYREIRRQADVSGESFPFGKLYPCLQEKDQESGVLAEHYFYQDLYVARKAHVASFREIEVLDVRDLHLGLPHIRFTQADLSAKEFPLIDYCDSLSCLHALEHFGLGRYGDPVDYNGHLVGWENMHRMLKKGGKFYFSVPIGAQRIEFNAHRVFSVKYLLHLMEKRYDIDSFAYINDAGDFISDAALDEASVRENFRCRYGCGIFEMTRR
jgi:SAM-dependent methyltransferase